MGTLTDEFAVLTTHHPEAQGSASAEAPHPTREFSDHDELTRLCCARDLHDHLDHWLEEWGDGISMVADARGRQTRERTTIMLSCSRAEASSIRLGYFFFDAIWQRASSMPRRLVLQSVAPPPERDLPLDDLIRLACLTDPALGVVRQMGDQQIAIICNGYRWPS
jgi:hypothetical protein